MMRLPSLLPKSIYGRVLLIVITPILILQMASAFIYFERHWSQSTLLLSENFTSNVIYLIDQHQRSPKNDRLLVQDAKKYFHMTLHFLPLTLKEKLGKRKKSYPILYRILHHVLSSKIPYPFIISSRYYYEGSNRFIHLRIQLPDSYMDIVTERRLVYTAHAYMGIVWIIGLSLGLILLSTLFVHFQTASIRRLANAAEDFGKGKDRSDFKPTGPLEIRRAAVAFLKMRSRIKQNMEQRTLILAGVSHDLRTAITKLKLHLALLKNVNVQKLVQDVHAMEEILESYLNFSKSAIEEKTEKVNLLTFIKNVVQTQFAKQVTLVNLNNRPPLILEIRPTSLRRCLCNIIDNAITYADHAWVEVHLKDGRSVHICIHDNGPGMTQKEFCNALKPFVSGKKGTGLGLTVAYDIIRAHGGEISASKSPYGGLKLAINLPI